MIISKKRIIKPDNYLLGINNGDRFYVSSPAISGRNEVLFLNAGFTANLSVGEQILPAAIGKITKFNSQGGFKVLKGQPKVPAQRLGRVKDWHGFYHTVTINYERYPREIIPPPSIEIHLIENLENDKIAVSDPFVNDPRNFQDIKHVINLFLEIFGECHILQENLLPALNVPVTRLNWDILPPGNYPWNILQPRIQNIINTVSGGGRQVIQDRFEFMASFNPNFIATGRAGFKGYFVFGYPNKPFFILESIYEGNATYVLGNNWNTIAQLSKAEILTNNHHLHRFIHTVAWNAEITQLM